MYTIYRILNTVNNKSYIGLTSDYESRIRHHSRNSGEWSAICKYFAEFPIECWEFSKLHDNIKSLEEASKLETQEIINYNSVVDGYNTYYFIGDVTGEKNPNSKLSKKQVIEIFLSSDSTTYLSKVYNIGVLAIQRIKSGSTWRLVTQEINSKLVNRSFK